MEAFPEVHISAIGFFDGVPLSVLYDNTCIAMAKICGGGRRERTRAFTELVGHYLFRDRFGRQGNDKGKVEGLVKYARSNFMTPIPVAARLSELPAADCKALSSLPAVPLEPCEQRGGRV